MDDGPPLDQLDLDAVERDLDEVERTLDQLDSGEYWSSEPVAGSSPGDDLG